MRKFGIGKFVRAINWVQKRFTQRGLILMYHRVAEKDIDPWSLCVTPAHFAEHLEVLQKHFNPMSLKQLVEGSQNGKIPNQAVVVTFDDGYANNLFNAKPLLEHYRIPATVFITTGYIEKNREYWWDELEHILLQPGSLPESLCLSINGHRWELGTAANYSEYDYRHDYDRYASESPPGSRLYLYYSIWEKLQPLPDEQRRKALDEILTWADTEPTVRLSHRCLTVEEIVDLESRELVEIGAHTVTHPLLPSHSPSVQHAEIRASKDRLEEIVGHPVISFSYPFGNFTKETVRLVRESGFKHACSADEETVWHGSDPFQLPRFTVEDWDGEEFERRLSRWLHS